MATGTEHGLEQDWLLAPGFDLELKQYVLLGYLQRVEARFSERKLYPHLDELWAHAKRLTQLQQHLQSTNEALGGEVIGVDLERAELVRAKAQESELLNVIRDVIDGKEYRDRFGDAKVPQVSSEKQAAVGCPQVAL